MALEKDILEVKNAIIAYSKLHTFDVYSPQSLLDAHKILMNGLIKNAGKMRDTSVGIVRGSQVVHVAPPSERLTVLINDLFDYLKNDSVSLLIKNCVFHYEFEFIHPFLDGNGRVGRLWQTLILKEHSPVFEFLPVETLIKEHRKEYYHALEVSDKAGISTSTASRDLKDAVDKGILERTEDKKLTKYRYFNRETMALPSLNKHEAAGTVSRKIKINEKYNSPLIVNCFFCFLQDATTFHI